MRIQIYLLSCWLALSALFSSPVIRAEGFGADLHFHLFMNQGMTWWFSGNADEPLKAKSWKNRWRSNANFETLENSGLKLAVVALYAHPLLVMSPRDSIGSKSPKPRFVAAVVASGSSLAVRVRLVRLWPRQQ